VSIPSAVDDLTPGWFTEILDAPVKAAHILDAHSGTMIRGTALYVERCMR
jgi:hypothetical protein